MIPVYYSHSYRDVPINKYFFELFEAVDIGPRADQKSDVWCVAKLERYLEELPAFVSVIPRRLSKDGRPTYSPYIGQELALARRARLPRLLFVDDLVLKQHRDDFPEDAVPFIYEAPASDRNLHMQSVHRFKENIAGAPDHRPRRFKPRKAVVVAPESAGQGAAADCVRDILSQESYNVTTASGKALRAAYDDVRLFESLIDAELCVFLIGGQLSWVHVLLAMAHAYSVPSIRLKYERGVKTGGPTLHGLIPWSDTSALAEEFKRQLYGFRRGFVEPVKISSDAGEAARSIGKMQWDAPTDQHWDTMEGAALIAHLRPGHSFVRDEVSRVRKSLGLGSLTQRRSRAEAMEVCRHLYDGLQRHNFAYEVEPQLLDRGSQVIRTPNDIETHGCANCIDLACLFGALLLEASQHPVIVVVDGPGFAHALAGYRAFNEPPLSARAGLSDLRGALARGDLVLFEPTGAVQSPTPVSVETEQERREADKMLQFMTAKQVAQRLIGRNDTAIRYIVDVDASRG